ncbi:competence/damage-inducible protein A [Legionella micdadei]|uniref:Competence-damage inducible protein n=1 Tax=Legionella micdadei TaxID=451 RepID=A0A098GDW7_LEGMI|nr:competence/damage-inducible protein A [Legionella micdadei]ARG98162.1 competence protein [Legionella micdadei]ARH00957.1 competence protein [Legionella micdadei]KTD29936.1 competence damage inducible protein CinA [Legionella micdadei]NSL19525.1 competence/damage-inducible protein A [Legionella micdadei]CEG60182.1 competence-damage inducible protein [Legionella micdadei]
MTIALLATGDEIIHGDTLNTNSHNLAHALSSEGLPLGLQLACSDKENELYDCLSFLALTHDIIIVTGGLGPTSDDRTRFALGRFLKADLVEFPQAIQHIQTRLGLDEKELNPGNRQQALFPANATILPNPNGTALGCYCNQENKVFILLPGPPRECLPMFDHYVLPLLQQMAHSDKQIVKWRLFGVAESQIAQQIDEALAGIDCKTGYRLETPYVECKVRCKNHLMGTVKQIVESIAAPYLIATPEQKASERLLETIPKLKIPISIVDEATGGILQTLIQQPSTYPWLKFYEDQRTILHFHLRGLKEYWSGEGKKGKTQVSIDYRSAKMNGEETHELPYRSPLVIHYAAEWLSFRLLHLINQLHQ